MQMELVCAGSSGAENVQEAALSSERNPTLVVPFAPLYMSCPNPAGSPETNASVIAMWRRCPTGTVWLAANEIFGNAQLTDCPRFTFFDPEAPVSTIKLSV